MDQIRYDKEHYVYDFNPIEFRQIIVNFLDENIKNKHIQWISDGGHGPKNEWVKKMSANAWCDEVFLRLVAIFLNRRIIVYPIFGKVNIITPHEQDNCDCDKSEQNDNEPLTLLYYEENYYSGCHYQRSQSFTSLMADLRQDINIVSSFSRMCLNGTFP